MFRPMPMHSSPMPYMANKLDALRRAQRSALRDTTDPVMNAPSPVSALVARPNPAKLRSSATTMSTPGWVPMSKLPRSEQGFVMAGERLLGTFPVESRPMPMPVRPGPVLQGEGPRIAVATPNELIAGGFREAAPSIPVPDALRNSVQNADTSGSVELPDGTVIDPSAPELEVPSGADQLLGDAYVPPEQDLQLRPWLIDTASQPPALSTTSKPPWLLILGVAGVAGGLLFLASR
jgi:hypothetical protein